MSDESEDAVERDLLLDEGDDSPPQDHAHPMTNKTALQKAQDATAENRWSVYESDFDDGL